MPSTPECAVYFHKFNPDFIFCRLHIIIVGDRALPVPFPGSLCPHLDSHVIVINRHFRQVSTRSHVFYLQPSLPNIPPETLRMDAISASFPLPCSDFFLSIMNEKSAVAVDFGGNVVRTVDKGVDCRILFLLPCIWFFCFFAPLSGGSSAPTKASASSSVLKLLYTAPGKPSTIFLQCSDPSCYRFPEFYLFLLRRILMPCMLPF